MLTRKEALIFEAIGAASMCWEHPQYAGVFNSDLACKIAHQLACDLGVASELEASEIEKKPRSVR